MGTKESDAELDALIAELTGLAVNPGEDAEYPLPESKPVKYTNVDVLVMPHGYQQTRTAGESISMDSLPLQLDLDSLTEANGVLAVPAIAAKEMVYDYDGVKCLNPFDELKAAALFANGIPVTREHPKSGIVTDRREVLGFFRDPVAEDGQLRGILELADKDMIADVKGKKLSEIPRDSSARSIARLGLGLAHLNPADEPVFNVPFLGKNHLRAWQDHELIAILPGGQRVYAFHPWEKNIARVKPYLYTTSRSRAISRN